MKTHRIRSFSLPLRSAPAQGAAPVPPNIFNTERVLKLREVPGEGGAWAEVLVRNNLGGERRGFVKPGEIAPDDFADVAPPEPRIDDKAKYIGVLALAAIRFGTSRDYLACICQMESGLTNPKPASPGGVQGPFQFRQSTWDDLAALDAADADPVGVGPGDIGDPIAQAFMAARLAAMDAKRLAPALAAPGPETAEGRLPTGAELYLGHLLGLGAGRAVLKARAEGGGAASLLDTLRDHYRGTAQGEGFADKVIAANENLMTEGGAPRSLDGLIGEIEARFDRAAEALAPEYARLPEGLRSAAPPPGGEPGWLAAARAELGVGEDNAPDRVRAFHTATGAPDEPETPWCASFVCWCLKNSGDARAAESALNTKRAANWIDWASPAGENPLVGDLLVTHPLARGASGHVGWLVDYAPDKGATIIGGNQGKPGAVTEMTVKPASIRAFRRLA